MDNFKVNTDLTSTAVLEMFVQSAVIFEMQTPLFLFLKEKGLVEEFQDFYLDKMVEKRRNEQETLSFFASLTLQANQKK